VSEWTLVITTRRRVKLKDCPPGPFLFNGSVGFKTEYSAAVPRDMGNGKFEHVCLHASDAYCLDSGEFFWGAVTTHKERDDLMVYPMEARPPQ